MATLPGTAGPDTMKSPSAPLETLHPKSPNAPVMTSNGRLLREISPVIPEIELMEDANAIMNLHPVPELPMSIWSLGARGNVPFDAETPTMPSDIWISAPKNSSPRIMLMESSPSSPT